jgi:hypothetical protein
MSARLEFEIGYRFPGSCLRYWRTRDLGLPTSRGKGSVEFSACATAQSIAARLGGLRFGATKSCGCLQRDHA